jgi:GT2 family glycosyltransferase
MLSIITAVHNQLAMNRIFHHYIKKYTDVPFELIIIDNGSTDGSREFFKSISDIPVKVMENDGNYSYPHCQNQGIDAAAYTTYAFLNNDIIVPPHWSSRLLAIMDLHRLEVLTSCGMEVLESKFVKRYYEKKWLWIKSIISLFGQSEFSLLLMFKVMYWNWERFSDRRYKKFGDRLIPGLAGHTIIMKQSVFEKIGTWDERIQAADHDLKKRISLRNKTKNDIAEISAALGVFHHHYVRLTCQNRSNYKPPPLKDQSNLIPIKQKWNIA